MSSDSNNSPQPLDLARVSRDMLSNTHCTHTCEMRCVGGSASALSCVSDLAKLPLSRNVGWMPMACELVNLIWIEVSQGLHRLHLRPIQVFPHHPYNPLDPIDYLPRPLG